jgi:uncharacterized protein
MHDFSFPDAPERPGAAFGIPARSHPGAHSCLYEGFLQHRRYAPRRHDFRYHVRMIYLDLAETDRVFRGRWLWSTRRWAPGWFRRADYLGDPNIPLERAVRDRVAEQTGCRPTGPVRMLTQLRCFGFCFNPVTFYYVFDAFDIQVETIVAEITNTPWNERHSYVLSGVLDTGRGATHRYRFSKSFHVSPFMQMALQYDWSFTEPDAGLKVYMCSREHVNIVFDAALRLERREMTRMSLARLLMRFPFVALQTLGAIYWQALRLWIKRVPAYTHPNKLAPAITMRGGSEEEVP